MKIYPRKNQILVKPEEEGSRVSKHGLITPSNIEQEQRAVGEILEVGVGIDDLHVGDTVVYGAYAGEKINMENNKFLLLHDEDVLATLKE